MKRRELLTAVALGAVAPSQYAFADTYPSRPIKLIVPVATGGSTDVIARAVSEALGRQLGQPVVVDNKGGAGGVIGTMEAVRAAPDGYTLLMATPSITAANPAINPRIPYNPVSDLTAIINVAAGPLVVAVNPKFPAKNYLAFLAELKRNPGCYSYASSGVGGIIHLQMEFFKSLTGVFFTHIPYRGAGPAVIDVVTGQVLIAYDALPSLHSFIKDGRLIPIVLTAPQRVKELPDTPTFKEVGLEPLNRVPHFGILGPKGLPREVIDKVNAATRRALEEPSVRKRIEDTGTVIMASTPEQFAAEIKTLYEQMKNVVAERKLTLD